MKQPSEETNRPAWSSRPAGYSSPSIRARRHRILKEARKMIADEGIANLSMDEISRRAGVAKRTLYNAFQSKERLIAAAIHEYFEDYASRITYSTDEATLERAIERLIVVAKRNLAIRNYTRALMNIYHSHGVDPDIRQTIHDIAAEVHEPLIRKLQRKRQLQPWIDAEELITNIIRFRYAIAHSWGEEQINDQEFLLCLVRGFLTMLAGATRGATRTQIEDKLRNLDSVLKHHLDKSDDMVATVKEERPVAAE
jgi:TetR/AcrR family transcriptional regulator, cholesterol catabolism regulator